MRNHLILWHPFRHIWPFNSAKELAETLCYGDTYQYGLVYSRLVWLLSAYHWWGGVSDPLNNVDSESSALLKGGSSMSEQ